MQTSLWRLKRWIVVYQLDHECDCRTSTKFPVAPSLLSSNSMTLVLNDPSWWPFINSHYIFSYFTVAASVGVIYDWALTFGQEIELFWRRRWSLMTILYLSVRYVGIGYAVLKMLTNVPTISITDSVSRIMYVTLESTNEVVNVMLGVIMIARLNVMYQRSRKVLVFLVVIFLAVRIANAVMAAISMMHISVEEVVLSDTYVCNIGYVGDTVLLYTITWILALAWEVLLLCLAVRIAVKRLRELRKHSQRGIFRDCFTVLMKTHVSYFASFLAVSCFYIGFYSPTLSAVC
ncbi:hypothetical protein DFJ58DRAFT_492860 [Suillus subalutaceus]|uniref:uncharacterized protein n=1 Tax=Suillus subalutaceus TaxID=48586 RepID=UPI001B88366F|nr:uncharacterized protein DFJ58DRAFT_492860 [Suillus subalutaceus]KAG1871234.1 hypothetical protein DFJ58DRAFT_492860 [Suillus subalutaceus]